MKENPSRQLRYHHRTYKRKERFKRCPEKILAVWEDDSKATIQCTKEWRHEGTHQVSGKMGRGMWIENFE